MTKAEELKAKSDDELSAMVQELDMEIFKLRNELKVARKLEKPHMLTYRKKERARILTILSEKQQGK